MKKVFVIAGTLMLIWTISAGAEGVKEAETTGFTSGEITYVEGTVVVAGNEVDFGTTVHSGSVIQTGPNSICDIVFGGKNILRFYENTTGTIDFSQGIVNLEQGSLGAVLEKLTSVIAGHGNRFLARSPQVVGGVRGTSFFLKIENETSSYLCICNGGMLYEDSSGENRKRIDAGHHKAFHYREVNGEIKAVTAKASLSRRRIDGENSSANRSTIPWDKSSGSY